MATKSKQQKQTREQLKKAASESESEDSFEMSDLEPKQAEKTSKMVSSKRTEKAQEKQAAKEET